MNPHKGIAISADNFPIFIALAAACVSCAAYLIASFLGPCKGRETLVGKIARISYYVSTVSAASALLYLLQCILSGARYDIAYVSDNSSPRDAFLYRVSALWAGQAGSMLLWAVFGGLTGVLLLRKLERSSPAVLSFWCSVQAFFLALLVVDDPMKPLVNFQPGSIGSGMKPLLQNPWMAIHPPVIFVAYALLAVPAGLAIQALIDGDAVKWVKRCLPWAIAGWLAMTAGLVLGMVWSYEVLGWGGYWVWDPVENASLVPWLLSTALVHALVLQGQRAGVARWNVVLAFATFISVLYTTFLTRSGVLSETSVHAFGDAENFRAMPVFAWLKWVPIGYGALFIGTLVGRWKALRSKQGKPLEVRSREMVLGVGILVLCLFAFVVLYGTTYSTFNGSSGDQARKDLKPIFYTVMSVPLALAATSLISLLPFLTWGGSGQGRGLRRILAAMGLIGVVAVVGVVAAILWPTLLGRVLGWLRPDGRTLLDANGLMLLLGLGLVALFSSAAAVAGSSLRRCGAHVAHAGVALVVLGIILSATGRSCVVDVKENGDPVQALGYTLKHDGTRPVADDRDVVNIAVEKGARRFSAPLHIVGSGRGVTMFPYIRNGLLADLYIAPDKILSDTITPYVTWDGKEWISRPAPISGSNAALALMGMQVEARSVRLRYLKEGARPVEFELSSRKPAKVDGYVFTLKGFASEGKDMMTSAGANIQISGRGHSEIAVLRVSTKPFMSLLWLGTILIMAGGCLALLHRRIAKG